MRIALIASLALLVAGCGAGVTPSVSSSAGASASGGQGTITTGEPPVPSPIGSPAHLPADTPFPVQTPAGPPFLLAAGDWTVVLVDGLRVRSKPSVEPDSVKYSPLLRKGMALTVLDGPVYGSGYWWYRVSVGMDTPCSWEEQAAGVCFLGFTNAPTADGWVAAADHNGTPWIGTGGCEVGPIDSDGPTWGPGDFPC